MVSVYQRPPKTTSHCISLFFDGGLFGSPNRGTNRIKRTPSAGRLVWVFREPPYHVLVASLTYPYAKADEINMRMLEEFHNREFVENQLKLQTMRKLEVKAQRSIDPKIFSVLQEIGFREGSLNGRDIKKSGVGMSN